MRILAIGAHPTDIIDLAGGALYKHFENGDKITACVATNGVFSHIKGATSMSRENAKKYKRLKKEEFKKAGKIVGIKNFEFLDLLDEPLVTNKATVEKIADIIRKHKPHTIISHHPNEYAHWDHAEMGKSVCRAIKSAIKYPSPDQHYVPNVYFYGVQFRPEMARIGFNPVPPTILVDITNVIQKKKDALFEFKLQGLDNVEMLQTRVDSFESETGRADGLKYSEAFISYYPLKTNLLPKSINTSFYTNKETN